MRRMLSIALAGSLAIAGAAASTGPAFADPHDNYWRWHWNNRGGGVADRHDRRVDRRHDHRDNHDHWDDDDFGDAAAAGIIGFAAGAIAGGALSSPPVTYVPSGHVARCRAEYQSYDVGSDTYLGYDGDRHYCRL